MNQFILTTPYHCITKLLEITAFSCFCQELFAILRKRSNRNTRKRRINLKQLRKPNRIRRKVKKNRGIKKTIWLREATLLLETSATLHWTRLWRRTTLSLSSSCEPVSIATIFYFVSPHRMKRRQTCLRKGRASKETCLQKIAPILKLLRKIL